MACLPARSLAHRVDQVGQLWWEHEPDAYGVHTLPTPEQKWQHRNLVPLCWQKEGPHPACAFAEGRSSSKIALPIRPMDCRINPSFLKAVTAGAARP